MECISIIIELERFVMPVIEDTVIDISKNYYSSESHNKISCIYDCTFNITMYKNYIDRECAYSYKNKLFR